MGEKYINIRFPFEEDIEKNFFVKLNRTDKDAIKSDLMHLIFTRRGERFYNPRFGTGLLDFIFEPNDNKTVSDIKADIQDAVNTFIPGLVISVLTVEPSNDDSEYLAIVSLSYVVSDGVFEYEDNLIVNI